MATTENEKRSQRSRNVRRKREASTKMDVLSVCATHQENLHHTVFYQVSLIYSNYNNILVYENRKFDSVWYIMYHIYQCQLFIDISYENCKPCEAPEILRFFAGSHIIPIVFRHNGNTSFKAVFKEHIAVLGMLKYI